MKLVSSRFNPIESGGRRVGVGVDSACANFRSTIENFLDIQVITHEFVAATKLNFLLNKVLDKLFESSCHLL